MADRGRGGRGGRGGAGGQGSGGSSLGGSTGGHADRSRGGGGFQGNGDRGRGGFRGRGGGRGGYHGHMVFGQGTAIPQPEPHITAQEDAFIKSQSQPSVGQVTRQMGELSVGSSSSSSDIFPIRPAFGHDGQEIVLWANYFKLEARAHTIYKYVLKVTHHSSKEPASSREGEANSRTKEAKGAKLHQLITAALAKLPNATLATEFKAQVISLTRLDLPASNIVQVDYTEPGRDCVETWNILFGNPIPIRVDQLVAYLRNMLDPSGDAHFPKFPDELDALGVIIGHTPRVDGNAVVIGRRRFFAIDARREQGVMPRNCLLSIFRGYFQSVRPATGRLLLNVNVTHGFFRAALPLADIFAASGINIMATIDSTRETDNDEKIRGFVRNAKIINQYLNRAKVAIKWPAKNGQIIHRFVTGLARKSDGQKEDMPPEFAPIATDFTSPYTTKFFLRQPAAGSKATIIEELKYDNYITVAEYFFKKYNIVADRKLPLVNIGSTHRPMYILAELCTIIIGQPMRTRLSPAERDAMINFSCRSPLENAASITTKARELLHLDGNPLLFSFGLSVSKTLITVKGRELSPPTVIYKGGTPVQPNDGGWLMKGVRVVKPGNRITKWTFVYSKKSERSPAAIKQTVNAFGAHCKRTGLDITAMPSDDGVAIKFEPNENTIQQAFKDLPKGTQVVLVILPYRDTVQYNIIKKVADVDLGILTICVVEQKLMQERGQLGYFTNVAIKLNLKTGGVNQTLQNEHPLLKSGRTMIVGYDVTHPTNIAIQRDQNGNEIRPPSMVGLVASIDKYLAQWPAEAWSNQGGVEMLDERLIEVFRRRLRLWWNKNNKQLPENIIIYRDGVSEGQFKTVLDKELPHIRKACKSVYDAQKAKQPRITIVVSVKRHQTRFYPTDPDHIHRNSKSPKEGTVVDRGVTNVRCWDFFLQAHASLQGKRVYWPWV
ncbi:Piwi-domain-containing protein [Coniochaeta sp. PMI_546]|nr:Piwi-domain-containing protein [Coniochaeta sp. PMI_546]